MAHLQSFAYPGFGKFAFDNLHYKQAIRVGDRIVCSGQGGWDGKKDLAGKEDLIKDVEVPKDLETEIDQAFANVDYVLKDAGGKGWSQVYRVTTYSTDIYAQHDMIVRNLRKWMPEHGPTWTEVGITHLGLPAMRFEVEVEAHDGAAEVKREA